MELTFKEACFDLTEGEIKWRVWFYADGSIRLLKNGYLFKEFQYISEIAIDLEDAINLIKNLGQYEKTT